MNQKSGHFTRKIQKWQINTREDAQYESRTIREMQTETSMRRTARPLRWLKSRRLTRVGAGGHVQQLAFPWTDAPNRNANQDTTLGKSNEHLPRGPTSTYLPKENETMCPRQLYL